MLIVGLVSWWYTAGWKWSAGLVLERLEATLDYFSVGLLIRTLFSPFRQISAGRVNGSFDVMVRAFFDRLISRCIGAVVRLIIICIGGIAFFLNMVFGGLALILWAVLPLLPLVGLVLFLMGWVPWSH